MVPKKVKFLLDENLDIKLAKILITLGLSCDTLRDNGWIGITNGELSQKVKLNKYVLITADKDFTFLWEKYEIQVIHVSIHPLVFSAIEPNLIRLFESWNYKFNPFIRIMEL
ncbi:MAG: DUF5615 family PIN-like protein [Candidatus Heimdallarchaeota archaeon]